MSEIIDAFDLATIRPSRGPQFSPNLYRWIRKQPDFVRNRLKVFSGKFDPTMQKRGCLYIGFLDEGGWFNGTRLYQVLCRGASKERYAYMPKHVNSLGLREIKNFWAEYKQIGRCAIDKEHTVYFEGDETRWKVNGDHRECLWCGKVKQKRKRWTETKIEKHEKWVTI